MIIYLVWRSNINIPLAGELGGPSLQILSAMVQVISEQRWRKMKGGSGIGGTHSDLVNAGDCEATLGTCMHFLYIHTPERH